MYFTFIVASSEIYLKLFWKQLFFSQI